MCPEQGERGPGQVNQTSGIEDGKGRSSGEYQSSVQSYKGESRTGESRTISTDTPPRGGEGSDTPIEYMDMLTERQLIKLRKWLQAAKSPGPSAKSTAKGGIVGAVIRIATLIASILGIEVM